MPSPGHKPARRSGPGKPARSKLDLSGLHRDWRTWLVIGLMLAAIGTYVLTLDESLQPGGPAPSSIPAAPQNN